jgi:hypothetical protein
MARLLDANNAHLMELGGCDTARCEVLMFWVGDAVGRGGQQVRRFVHVTDGHRREVVVAVWDDGTRPMIDRMIDAWEAAVLAAFPRHHGEHTPPVVASDWEGTP